MHLLPPIQVRLSGLLPTPIHIPGGVIRKISSLLNIILNLSPDMLLLPVGRRNLGRPLLGISRLGLPYTIIIGTAR
jgi:hypothetical protein